MARKKKHSEIQQLKREILDAAAASSGKEAEIPFLKVDLQFNILQIGASAQNKLASLSQKTLETGDSFLDLFRLKDLLKIKGLFKNALEGNQVHFETIPQATEHPLHFRMIPQFNISGKVEEFYIQVQDKAFGNYTLDKELREERNMLRSIIDNIPDYIFVKDLEHRTILSNKAFNEGIMGTGSEDEIIGLRPDRYFEKEKARDLILDNERVFQTGEPVINRREIAERKDGEKEVVLLTKVPLKDSGGITKGLIGIARNISENYALEQEQKLVFNIIQSFNEFPELQPGLRETIKAIAHFFQFEAAEAWEVGYDKRNLQRVATFNADLWKEKGEGEIISFGLGEGLPGKCWEAGELLVWKQLQEDERFLRKYSVQEGKVITGIGVPVIFRGDVISVLTFFGKNEIPSDSSLVKTLGRLSLQVSADIQRKMVETRLNKLFQNSPNLVGIISKDGYLQQVNPSFSRIFGYSEEELLQTYYLEFIHPEDIKASQQSLQEMFSGKIVDFQNRCRTKDGNWRWITWRASEIINEEGVIYLFGVDITPLKNSNLQLYKYRNIFESSKDAIGMLNLDSGEIYMNKAFQKVSGYSEEEFDGIESLKNLYAEKEAAGEMFAELLQGNFWDGDLELRSKFDEVLDYHLSAGPIFNEKNELIAIFGIHNDISERKKYEAEIRNYSRKINNILGGITDAFTTISPEGEVIMWNEAAERLTSLDKEDILGQNIWELFPVLKKQLFYKKFQEALETGKQVDYEELWAANNRWIAVTAYPNEEGVSAFFRDITNKRNVEEEIRIAKERYDLISRVTREAVYDWDLKTYTLEWSEAYYTVFGYERSSSEKNIQKWKEKVHPDDLEGLLEHLHHSLQNSSDKEWENEYRMFRPNGEIAYVFERGFIIRDDSGEPVRMIGSIQDVTELRQNEKTLEKLNKDLEIRADELMALNVELEQFAYIASHDLQEPLRMVTSFLSQLQKKYESQLDEKAQRYIHFAYDGATRMRKIILDLLEYSRAGRKQLKPEEVDLNDLISDIEKLCQKSEARIKYEKLPTIKIARTPLQQVLINLISNSLKYSKSDIKPVIEVKVEEKESKWLFTIADNGIGIDPDFHHKIFVVFQRLHQKEEYSGTGIGLAICKKIIEKLEGKIWLESEEGKGSKFYFTVEKQF